jgi:hypothetical protein
MNARARVQPVRTKLRIRLLIAAACVTIFAILHHVDHIIRGNHSGWPFQEAVTPFTFSLLIYALLLPGLYLTAKGGLMAGYWLFTAVVGLALVLWVHFVPTGDYEAPIEDIYAVYGSPLAGLLALVVLAGLVSCLVTLALTAIQALLSAKRPLDEAEGATTSVETILVGGIGMLGQQVARQHLWDMCEVRLLARDVERARMRQ